IEVPGLPRTPCVFGALDLAFGSGIDDDGTRGSLGLARPGCPGWSWGRYWRRLDLGFGRVVVFTRGLGLGFRFALCGGAAGDRRRGRRALAVEGFDGNGTHLPQCRRDRERWRARRVERDPIG